MLYTIRSLERNGSIIGQCTLGVFLRLYSEYDIWKKRKNENGGVDVWVIKKERELIGYDKDSDKEYKLSERDREIIRGLRTNIHLVGMLSDEEIDRIGEMVIKLCGG